MSCLRSRAPNASSARVRIVMQANSGQDTRPEQVVRSLLHRSGLRFRKNVRPLPSLRCAADVVFPRAKACIFVDGCFWHGCPAHFRVPMANAEWWAEKIEANRVRDRRNNVFLRRKGWQVIRLWEHDPNARALGTLASRIRSRIVATSSECKRRPRSTR